jgi:hypothetical protein
MRRLAILALACALVSPACAVESVTREQPDIWSKPLRKEHPVYRVVMIETPSGELRCVIINDRDFAWRDGKLVFDGIPLYHECGSLGADRQRYRT